jgi:SAM-dependent methyltransferase
MSTEGAGRPADQPWSWDASLYAGSAEFYAVGRAAYPAEIADRLRTELGLDGQGRLLDVGCGPGSLTLLLAPLFGEAIGVDADADMLTVAARLAAAAHLDHVSWRHLRGEDLPADLPEIRVATLAQSFHWMDRPRVASALRGMLAPAGALVHVSATTHEGVPSDATLPHPQPPRAAIQRLVQQHLGDRRRAGRGVLPSGTAGGEDVVYRAAGFMGPHRIVIAGRVLERTVEEVVASVYSLSSSTPHLLGDRLPTFDADLRRLLRQASPSGRFSEQMGSITLHLWR